MADFVQVMNDWSRMCASMQGGIAKCDNCPLFKVLCQYRPNEKVDLVSAEKIIEKWAEDNPAPVYPTWWEYLRAYGVTGVNIPDSAVIYKLKNWRIPADIAQKPGVEPVPVVHGDCGATNETDARKKLGIEPE